MVIYTDTKIPTDSLFEFLLDKITEICSVAKEDEAPDMIKYTAMIGALIEKVNETNPGVHVGFAGPFPDNGKYVLGISHERTENTPESKEYVFFVLENGVACKVGPPECAREDQ